MSNIMIKAASIVVVTTISMTSPSFAAEKVTINGNTNTYCTWTGAAAAMRRAAQAGNATLSNWKKLEKTSVEALKCKADRLAKKAAKAKAKADLTAKQASKVN